MEDQAEYQTGEKIVSGKPENEWTESLTQMAEGAGLYFKALKKAEIPHDLAIRLVEEWHRAQWESVFRDA